jgi:hypothetical protein
MLVRRPEKPSNLSSARRTAATSRKPGGTENHDSIKKRVPSRLFGPKPQRRSPTGPVHKSIAVRRGLCILTTLVPATNWTEPKERRLGPPKAVRTSGERSPSGRRQNGSAHAMYLASCVVPRPGTPLSATIIYQGGFSLRLTIFLVVVRLPDRGLVPTTAHSIS